MDSKVIKELKRELGNENSIYSLFSGSVILLRSFEYIFFLRLVNSKCYVSGIYLGGLLGDFSNNNINDRMETVTTKIENIVSKYNYCFIKLYYKRSF